VVLCGAQGKRARSCALQLPAMPADKDGSSEPCAPASASITRSGTRVLLLAESVRAVRMHFLLNLELGTVMG